MTANQAKLLLSCLSQRFQVLRATDGCYVFASVGNFQLFDRITLVFVFIVIDYLAGCASQCHETLLRTAGFNRSVAAKIFRPTFFKQHDPYLLIMRFGIERSCASARKTFISFNYFPLTVNKEFDCVVVGWIFIEEKALGYQLWIHGNYGGNATQEVTITH
jgi:hypothetical protein